MTEEVVAHVKKVPVIEIFGPTMQGEGIACGQRTIFIRFGLCDYKCRMCDSMHAVDPRRVKETATWYEPRDLAELVLKRLADTNCANVTLSGGNPCIHNLTELVEAFNANNIYVSVETQGTLAPDWIRGCDYVTVSPKGPGMGEKFELVKYLTFLDKVQDDSESGRLKVCIKIPVFDSADLQFASDVWAITPEWAKGPDNFFLSVGNAYPPGLEKTSHVSDIGVERAITMSLENLLEDLNSFPMLKYARLLPQVHVLVWGNKQGV